MNKLEVTFKWENENSFSMTAKVNDDDKIAIIEVEEDGCIEELWGGIEGVCIKYLQHQLRNMGKDMSA